MLLPLQVAARAILLKRKPDHETPLPYSSEPPHVTQNRSAESSHWPWAPPPLASPALALFQPPCLPLRPQIHEACLSASQPSAWCSLCLECCFLDGYRVYSLTPLGPGCLLREAVPGHSKTVTPPAPNLLSSFPVLFPLKHLSPSVIINHMSSSTSTHSEGLLWQPWGLG